MPKVKRTFTEAKEKKILTELLSGEYGQLSVEKRPTSLLVRQLLAGLYNDNVPQKQGFLRLKNYLTRNWVHICSLPYTPRGGRLPANAMHPDPQLSRKEHIFNFLREFTEEYMRKNLSPHSIRVLLRNAYGPRHATDKRVNACRSLLQRNRPEFMRRLRAEAAVLNKPRVVEDNEGNAVHQTFGELGETMVEEHDFDENLSNSPENTQQDTIALLNSSQDFNEEIRCENSTETEMEIKTERCNHSANKDPELFEEFHAVGEVIKSEETRVIEKIENVDTNTATILENCEKARSESPDVIFESIIDTSMPLLCRLCASQQEDMIQMFGSEKTRKNIVEKIEHCLPILVRETDNLPKEACRSCLAKLELFHQFYEAVTVAEKQLIILSRNVKNEFRKTEHDFIQCLNDAEKFNEDTNNNVEIEIKDETSGNSGGSANLILHSEESSSRLSNHRNNPDEGDRIDGSSIADQNVDPCVDALTSDGSSTSLVKENIFYATSNIPKTQLQLNGHKAKHSDKKMNRNFSCDNCGKSFPQKGGLVIHMRSHNPERPFDCAFCEKSYKTRTVRNHHQGTHNGEKPFKCLICGKTFAQSPRLYEHARVHSAKKPHKCSFCDKSFKRIHDRNLHLTVHTGKKPYRCVICEKHFRWPASMRRHKRNQHGQT